jgi:hypothetical protein
VRSPAEGSGKTDLLVKLVSFLVQAFGKDDRHRQLGKKKASPFKQATAYTALYAFNWKPGGPHAKLVTAHGLLVERHRFVAVAAAFTVL